MEESFGTISKQKNRVENIEEHIGFWKDNKFGWQCKMSYNPKSFGICCSVLLPGFYWLRTWLVLLIFMHLKAVSWVLCACIGFEFNCIESGMNLLDLQIFCVLGTYWLTFLKFKDLLVFRLDNRSNVKFLWAQGNCDENDLLLFDS